MLNDIVNIVIDKIRLELNKGNSDLRLSNLGLDKEMYVDAINHLRSTGIIHYYKNQNDEATIEITKEGKKIINFL